MQVTLGAVHVQVVFFVYYYNSFLPARAAANVANSLKRICAAGWFAVNLYEWQITTAHS